MEKLPAVWKQIPRPSGTPPVRGEKPPLASRADPPVRGGNLSTTSWSPSLPLKPDTAIREEICSLIGELAAHGVLRGKTEGLFQREKKPPLVFDRATPPVRVKKLYHKFSKREELFLSQNDISIV